LNSVVNKVFTSKTENLSEIRKFVENFLEVNSVSLQDKEKIILAIDEACTNKIKHAYNFDGSKLISITLEIKDKIFIARISDWGKSFEPTQIPVPDLEENYKSRKKGGYGIYLMKKLMDQIEYKFLESGENVIILKRKISFNNEQ
jgi:serine/threonine-protein kinase RsbW